MPRVDMPITYGKRLVLVVAAPMKRPTHLQVDARLYRVKRSGGIATRISTGSQARRGNPRWLLQELGTLPSSVFWPSPLKNHELRLR